MTSWKQRATGSHLVTTILLPVLLAVAVLVGGGAGSGGIGVGVAHADPVPTDDAIEAAAGWLARELVDGERIEGAFGPDAGLTADVVFALAAAGVASGSIADATDWLESQVGSYTGTGFEPPSVFAGATAKLVLVAAVTGRDPAAFGGTDLVAQLEEREQADGRFTDESGFGDFSSTLTQSLAVLALHRADGTVPSPAAVQFLLDQQCGDGSFRFDPDATACTGSPDTTGFAIQALYAIGEDAAADAAVDWYVGIQSDDGSFSDEGVASVNSTGLAAVALALGGRDDATGAARDWILALQAGCDDAAPGSIRADPEDAGDRDRATAQAVPGLAGTSLATMASADAAPSIPILSCPDPVDDDPGGDPADDGTAVEAGSEVRDDEQERPFPVPSRIDTGGGGLAGGVSAAVAIAAAAVFALAGLAAALRRRRAAAS